MAPVIVGRFATVIEAQIAASALRSGGLHPEVLDSGYGSMLWTQQLTVPGFRVMVPASEAADAIAYFQTLPAVPADLEDEMPRSTATAHLWRPLAFALLFVSPYFGWLGVGLRPDRPKRPGAGQEMMMGMVLTTAIVIGLFIALIGGGLFIFTALTRLFPRLLHPDA
jgi:hypothetical protein